MKKVFNIVMMALWVLGTIGGFGYACYSEAYLIAVGCAACGYMAWPTVKEYFNGLVL